MNKVSRRALARYAAQQLISGKAASEVAKHLAGLMVDSGRSAELEFLLGDIAWELEHRGELSTSKVTTAHPLSRELVNNLKAEIKKATQTRGVILEEDIDKSVIGGARIETAGQVWDGTVARKLANLREAFSPAKLSHEAVKAKADNLNESLGG